MMVGNKLKTLFYFKVLIILLSQNSFAQSDDTFLAFDQFFQNYNLINPANSDTTHSSSVSIANTRLIGLFEGVNRNYLNIDIGLNRNNRYRQSRVGALLISNNDGVFINRSRYYVRYSYSTAISSKDIISAGLSIGGVTYSFKGTQGFQGGKSSALDAGAGLWWLHKNLRLGLSVQQFLGSVVAPVQQQFKLEPVVNLNFVYNWEISSNISLSNHLFVRNQANTRTTFDLAPVLLIKKLLETGVTYRHNRGVAILVGLKSIRVGKGSIRFMSSFLFSTRNLASSSDNKLEFSAGYSL